MQSLSATPINSNTTKNPDTKSQVVTSAPPGGPESKQDTNENQVQQTNNSLENKTRHLVSSERLTMLRKMVDDAIREHKTFTVKGGWQTIRYQLLLRGWIEKQESVIAVKQKPAKEVSAQGIEDVCSNLPVKQEWETQAAYVLKCERTIMSRMLQNHNVDFYWNMRRESGDWQHRINSHQIMNRFARSIFTSKEGLNLLLQQMHWHCEPGVAFVNFPRCYTLGFPDHYNNFVDDFRLTACISILKWFVNKYEEEDEFAIKSPDGRVPYTSIQFALDRCNDFIASQKHLDIDRDTTKIWNHEWDKFLSNYYLVVHEHAMFIDSNEWTVPLLNAAARTTLNEIAKYWSMIDLDGNRNIWIVKPGNKCRGRGIQLVKHLEDVTKIVNMKLKYVVQKYIEKPLLIYQTKFDIRQWFMVTSVQPLNIWMYKECYLRFSTQIFNLDNFHESLHLTNHAVQRKYANVVQRDKALPEQNMWDCHTFKNYLTQNGYPKKWDDVIYPGLRENIVGAMLACQDTMDRRPNTFELYGADFIIAEDFKPWLLEINSSPDLSASTAVTSKLCPQVLQDLIKVMIDKRRNPNADTGSFELVYKQTLPRPPAAYLGTNLSIRGRKVFKNKRSKGKEQKDRENKVVQQHCSNQIASNLDPSEFKLDQKTLDSPPRDFYTGPVIEDFIEQINKTLYPKGAGYEYVPPPCSQPVPPKKKASAMKNERVSKADCASHKSKTNKHHFASRKPNVRENSRVADVDYKKPRTIFIRSAYFGLLKEWKFKNKSADNSAKEGSIWGKDTSSILNGETLLSKFNIENNNGSAVTTNKKSLPIPRCYLSSVNLSLSLPQLHRVDIDLPFSQDFKNIGGVSGKVGEPKPKSAKGIYMNHSDGNKK